MIRKSIVISKILSPLIVSLLLLLILGTLFIKGSLGLDPDFGHRIATGNLILDKGIPMRDPFSYTMPSYPLVDHAWLIDVGIAFFYPKIGKASLAVIFSVLTLLALIISMGRQDLRTYPKSFLSALELNNLRIGSFMSFPFLLAVAILFSFASIRAQVVSWVMLAICLNLILTQSLYQKTKFLIPVFFILWSNLHGSFALGIISFGLVVLARAIRKKSLEPVDFLILTLSVLGTLINPYGAGVWREAWSSGADPQLRFIISEWKPIFFAFDPSIFVLITLSCVLLFRYRSKFFLEEKYLFIFYLLQAVSSVRHIPLWVILALPMTTRSIFLFYKEISKDKIAVVRFKKANQFAWIGSLVLLSFSAFFTIKDSIYLSENVFYPKRAVSYLKENLPQGEVFSEYGWGGYLIWKLPQKRVFIDGRMPSWRTQMNLPLESNSAMDDYKKILEGDLPFRQAVDRWRIEVVLWPKPKKESYWDYLDKKLYNLMAKFGKKRRDFDFLAKLEEDGWMKVYDDGIAVIYRRPS